MQNSLLKRNFLSRIQSLELDDEECGFQGPQKLVKKTLQIEIPEIRGEENIPPPIPTLCAKTSKFVFNSLKSVPSTRASTSTPTRFSDGNSKHFDFPNFRIENNSKYDNYYERDAFYNLTMRRCHRKAMEDRATCEKHFDAGSNTSFFGVYDGHRNSYASDFLQKNLHKCILNHSEFPNEPKKALREAFLRLDQEICRNQEKFNLQGGSTALCVLMDPKELHLANVGDCKAVMIRDGKPVNLNIEHRANNEKERRVVESRGGVIFEKKGKHTTRYMVLGSLELTRSIGDQAYKKYISCEPDIIDYQLHDDDEYLVLGSDGFWNESNEQELCESIKRLGGNTEDLSKALVDEVMKKKNYSVDNITLLVVDVKKFVELKQEQKM